MRPATFVLLCSFLSACSSQPGSQEPDAGAPDGGAGPVVKGPGTRFETTVTAWSLPAGGLKLNGFNATANQTTWEQLGDQYWLTRDLTGDGLPDLVVTTVIRTQDAQNDYDEPFDYPANPHWLVYPGTATGFAPTAVRWSVPKAGGVVDRGFNRIQNQEATGGLDARIKNDHGEFNFVGDQAWRVFDIDGDRRPDLVVTGVAQEIVMVGPVFRVFGSTGAASWKVYKNNGSGFDAAAVDWHVPSNPQWDTSSGLANAASGFVTSYRTNLWTYGDLDGDAKPELIAYADVQMVGTGASATWRSISPGFPAAPHWNVFKNTGSGFSDMPQSWALPVQRGLKNVGLSSVTGSGKEVGEHAWTVADLDGDAKPDLLVTGSVVGGDMKAIGYPGDAHWELYPNTGSGFGGQVLWALPPGGTGRGGFFATANTAATQNGDMSWSTVDLDGDGKRDLVVTGQLFATPAQKVFQYGRQANDPQWLLFRNTGAGFAQTNVKWVTPAGGLLEVGFPSVSGAGAQVGDQSWELLDLDGDKHPELVVSATTIEDPENPGGGQNIKVVPGYGTTPRWMIYWNRP